MISLEKRWILTPLQKMPKALKSCPKSNKSANLVTLLSAKGYGCMIEIFVKGLPIHGHK